MWCEFLPSSRRICSVHSAFLTNARKNSSASSVSKSPTFCDGICASKLRCARPEKSTADRMRASSIGIIIFPYLTIPFLSESARLKALPSAIPVSSTVWCASTYISPLQVRFMSNLPCFAKRVIIWSKNPQPLLTLHSPLPSMLRVRLMSVSAVFLFICAVLIAIVPFVKYQAFCPFVLLYLL